MLQREIEARLDRPCRSAEALGVRKASSITFAMHLFDTRLYTTIRNKIAKARGCIVQRCVASYHQSLHSKNF
jgi:hypothetical protein